MRLSYTWRVDFVTTCNRNHLTATALSDLDGLELRPRAHTVNFVAKDYCGKSQSVVVDQGRTNFNGSGAARLQAALITRFEFVKRCA